MKIEMGYVVVVFIAGILLWQAMIHLGSKNRKRSSLIGAFTMDDIEVSDGPIQPRVTGTQSLLTARVDSMHTNLFLHQYVELD